MTDMIRTTTTNILKNGIKNRLDGYCYLVTPENYDFWCEFTHNCSVMKSLKTRCKCIGYLYFYGVDCVKYSTIDADIDGVLYYKAEHLQRILVEEKLLMMVN